jgi:hypothetical protein
LGFRSSASCPHVIPTPCLVIPIPQNGRGICSFPCSQDATADPSLRDDKSKQFREMKSDIPTIPNPKSQMPIPKSELPNSQIPRLTTCRRTATIRANMYLILCTSRTTRDHFHVANPFAASPGSRLGRHYWHRARGPAQACGIADADVMKVSACGNDFLFGPAQLICRGELFL